MLRQTVCTRKKIRLVEWNIFADIPTENVGKLRYFRGCVWRDKIISIGMVLNFDT